MIQFLTVFAAMFVTDVCWTFYLLSVESRKSVIAGMWAAALYIFGAFVVRSYVEDHTMIIAAALGSFAGTVATIEYKLRREIRNKKRKIQNWGTNEDR